MLKKERRDIPLSLKVNATELAQMQQAARLWWKVDPLPSNPVIIREFIRMTAESIIAKSKRRTS